ncbi:MAG: hypothetical protein DIZ78_09540 [endosymbiont of Escarpia spicata]|uniref:Uncharacterized protein n=1 Tax=endosymbiont of Escarpia spicata TaxID=2200908 RepID=A0A370DNB7_9GAMM|nr:MAG: hypothetical protein DIZ78_09540 [endosymbiont of Escarpia spicata]
MTEKKKSHPTMTVTLTDKPGTDFETVKTHIKEILPGVEVNAASVGRYALHLAAETISDLKQSEIVPGAEAVQ